MSAGYELESRPAELPRQPLAERYVNLSTHTAPIRQTFIIHTESNLRCALLSSNARPFLASIRQMFCFHQNLLPTIWLLATLSTNCWQRPSRASRQCFSIQSRSFKSGESFKKPPDAAPSLHSHYRSFNTTTNGSAPVRSIGTQALVGSPPGSLP